MLLRPKLSLVGSLRSRTTSLSRPSSPSPRMALRSPTRLCPLVLLSPARPGVADDAGVVSGGGHGGGGAGDTAHGGTAGCCRDTPAPAPAPGPGGTPWPSFSTPWPGHLPMWLVQGQGGPSSSASAGSHARRCCSPVRAVLDPARSTQPVADLAWGVGPGRTGAVLQRHGADAAGQHRVDRRLGCFLPHHPRCRYPLFCPTPTPLLSLFHHGW